MPNDRKFLNSGQWLIIVFASFVTSIVAIVLFLFFAQREPVLGGNFSLQHRAITWTFVDHAKPLNLLYIGYAKCPDVCPFALASTAEAYRDLSESDQKKIQVIFISVDFENDTDESVDDFAMAFNPSFIGLTGPKDQIVKTVQLFGASFVKERSPKSYLGYKISHTDRLFFLNTKGKIVDALSNPRDSELIKNKIKEML